MQVGKDKRGKRKAPRRARPSPEQPAGRPAGTNGADDESSAMSARRWEMPYSAVAPRLINPDLGLHHLVTRADHHSSYEMDLTLLDAPDHRLLRSGVLLAHRVLEGRGEWYLAAPDWEPLLPAEQIVPMSHGDLPEELADLARPFRRGAPIGPVAALSCERREFALRDGQGESLARLRDDKVTVRRGGLTTARYREVTMTPEGPGLTGEQTRWLSRGLSSMGATPVPAFPELVSRLGAPSTGPTDFPVPQPADPEGTFGQFVSGLLAQRLRELLRADLGVRAGTPGAARELADAAGRLRAELEGLASVLDPGWLEDLDEGLIWLEEIAAEEASRSWVGTPAAEPGPDPEESDLDPAESGLDREEAGAFEPSEAASVADPTRPYAGSTDLLTRLRGERYLTLLDRLVTAARAPGGGDTSTVRCQDVLQALLDGGLHRLSKTASRLRVDSAPKRWEAARTALDSVIGICAVFAAVAGDQLARLQSRLVALGDLLDTAAARSQAADRTRSQVATATPDQAFELGRRYAAEQQEAVAAREAFLRHWSKVSKRLSR